MAKLEIFDGTNWIQLGGGTGTVTFVGITGSTGLSVSGSPITTNGTINLTLGSELQALSAFASTGLMARTASNTYTARTITASTGINISNGNGIAGNPTVSVFNIPINTLSGYPGTNTSVLFGNGTWNDLTLTGAVEGYIVSGGIISTSLNQTQSFFGAVNFNWNLINNASLKFNTYGGDDFNLVIGNNNYNWNITTNCSTFTPYFEISFLNTTYPPTPSWFLNDTPFQIVSDNIDIQKLMLLVNANIDINFNKIRNLATPINNNDGVNKLYADSLITPQLSALSSLSTTGIMIRTGANSFTTRNLVPGVGLGILNADGVLGDPTLSVVTSLQQLVTLSNGFAVRKDAATYINRTLTAGSGITITNGDGITGNPIISWNSSSIYINSLSINGLLNLSTYGLTTSGDINAQTGTLKGNNLAAYNSGNIYVTSGFAMNNNVITGLPTPLNGSDAANKFFVESILANNSINVNTVGGNSNYLRRNINTTTNIQVYGLTNNGYIIEQFNGESAGIGFDGSTDTCTIWTAGDGGSFLNIQDEDSTNSRVAYVATNGAWTPVSSKTRKHSIKEKKNNNVLDRFLSLSVKSYGYKYNIEDDYSEDRKQRIIKKQKKMSVGLILEELFDIFPNCIPYYYNELGKDGTTKKKLNINKEIKDISNCGIDYNVVLCYFILAFQEYVRKTDKIISNLGKKLNE